MFDGGGGKGVQGVIKHHNSVPLPRVKERQRRSGGGGDERISHFHVRERGRRGRWEEKRSTKPHYILLISVISATCLCTTGLWGFVRNRYSLNINVGSV